MSAIRKVLVRSQRYDDNPHSKPLQLLCFQNLATKRTSPTTGINEIIGIPRLNHLGARMQKSYQSLQVQCECVTGT